MNKYSIIQSSLVWSSRNHLNINNSFTVLEDEEEEGKHVRITRANMVHLIDVYQIHEN